MGYIRATNSIDPHDRIRFLACIQDCQTQSDIELRGRQSAQLPSQQLLVQALVAHHNIIILFVSEKNEATKAQINHFAAPAIMYIYKLGWLDAAREYYRLVKKAAYIASVSHTQAKAHLHIFSRLKKLHWSIWNRPLPH
jgi:hypothetical protein